MFLIKGCLYKNEVVDLDESTPWFVILSVGQRFFVRWVLLEQTARKMLGQKLLRLTIKRVSLSQLNRHVSPISSFAACLPGLEHIVEKELRKISPDTELSVVGGGVEFDANVELLMKCGLCLGSASHLMIRIASFKCRALGELERKLGTFPWKTMLRDDVPYEVSATAKQSRCYHSGAIEERVRSSIDAAFKDSKPPSNSSSSSTHNNKKTPPLNNKPGVVISSRGKSSADHMVRIHVRFHDDICTISLETTSTPLYRRGYRQGVAKAPLREDIAHALCLAVIDDRIIQEGCSVMPHPPVIVDPFCGSGTIPIEAAGIYYNLPPGRLRPPPLSHLAMFNPKLWDKVYKECTKKKTSSSSEDGVVVASLSNGSHGLGKLISGSDRDAGAIKMAMENASRAGVSQYIDLQCCALKSHPWLLKREYRRDEKASIDGEKLLAEEEEEGDSESQPLHDTDDDINNEDGDVKGQVTSPTTLLSRPRKGIILTNPPFGVRVSKIKSDTTNPSNGSDSDGESSKRNQFSGSKQLWPLYQSIGNTLKDLGRRWKVTMLAHDLPLVRRSRVKLQSLATTQHGGLSVSFMSSNMKLPQFASVHSEQSSGVDEDKDSSSS
jgi:putative N6-adenine-specific DNA methylase